MMKRLLLFSTITICLFTACNNTPTDELYNTAATLPKELLQNISQWKVISTVVDRTHKTMSVLYGNEAAAHKAAGSTTYPPGTALCMVTWKQQSDQHWFGGRIPGNTQLVEMVRIGETDPLPVYERYEGSPLQKNTTSTPALVKERMLFIMSRRTLVIP
jgi:hypothetical protein